MSDPSSEKLRLVGTETRRTVRLRWQEQSRWYDQKDFWMKPQDLSRQPYPLSTDPLARRRSWPWRMPSGRPKRPLAAYNVFYKDKRKEILASSE